MTADNMNVILDIDNRSHFYAKVKHKRSGTYSKEHFYLRGGKLYQMLSMTRDEGVTGIPVDEYFILDRLNEA